MAEVLLDALREGVVVVVLSWLSSSCSRMFGPARMMTEAVVVSDSALLGARGDAGKNGASGSEARASKASTIWWCFFAIRSCVLDIFLFTALIAWCSSALYVGASEEIDEADQIHVFVNT